LSIYNTMNILML